MMQKPFCANRFFFLVIITFLLAGLQYIARENSSLSCSPFCRTLLGKNSQVFAASTPDNTSSKKAIAHPEIPRMPAAELAQLLKKKADIVILDTQSPDDYAMWHIPSSINVPYIPAEDPTARQLKLMSLPMEKLIVIYCLCEEGLDSAKVAIELKQLGYKKEKIKVLEGGMILWDEAGYPMVKQKTLE
jgi:rhodanese-related sulfurtransferase